MLISAYPCIILTYGLNQVATIKLANITRWAMKVGQNVPSRVGEVGEGVII